MLRYRKNRNRTKLVIGRMVIGKTNIGRNPISEETQYRKQPIIGSNPLAEEWLSEETHYRKNPYRKKCYRTIEFTSKENQQTSDLQKL